MLRQIAELDKDLANLEKSVSGEIMDTVLKDAAEQLKDEQARILSGAPSDGIRSLAKEPTAFRHIKKTPRSPFNSGNRGCFCLSAAYCKRHIVVIRIRLRAEFIVGIK